MTPGLVGVDWGTTNRRAYRLDGAGVCVAEHADADGLLAARGRFAQSLDVALAALGVEDPGMRVVMSGMVGSASGWVEAPYLDLSTPLDELSSHLVPVPGANRRCYIVPGYCQRSRNAADVMRGEETQLLGALALGCGDGWFVLPGTHSKWVQLRGGRIDAFTTYMTGELFDLLARLGTLADAAGPDGETSAAAFLDGVRAEPDAALSHALFGCRARVVAGIMPAAQAHSYLSGLLIGAEWHDVRRRCGGRLPSRLTLIGSAKLAARYGAVAAALDVVVDVLDPRAAYLAALAALEAQPASTLLPASP